MERAWLKVFGSSILDIMSICMRWWGSHSDCSGKLVNMKTHLEAEVCHLNLHPNRTQRIAETELLSVEPMMSEGEYR